MRTVAAAAGCLVVSVSLVATPTPEFVITPVVGHWETVTDEGAPAAIADGTRWDGKSGPDLRALASTLFKTPHQAFAKNMDPATAFAFAVVAGVDDFSAGTIRGRFKRDAVTAFRPPRVNGK